VCPAWPLFICFELNLFSYVKNCKLELFRMWSAFLKGKMQSVNASSSSRDRFG
jgi:hypothetical protein